MEGPLPNDFAEDLSGLHFNAGTGVLWVSRNGGTGGSKVWALEQDGGGAWLVATRNGARAEWSGFGDAESLTQAPGMVDDVLVLDEGNARVTWYSLATGGVRTSLTHWNVGGPMPEYDGDLGPEAITFVPDDALATSGFVDGLGVPLTLPNPLGGILLVGHQNEGHIYAFRLPQGQSAEHLGTYETGRTEVAGLEWDSLNARLLIWHGASFNQLSVSLLTSSVAGSVRRLDVVQRYRPPGGGNHEGIAVTSTCRELPDTRRVRTFLLATDDAGDNALRAFSGFPCSF